MVDGPLGPLPRVYGYSLLPGREKIEQLVLAASSALENTRLAREGDMSISTDDFSPAAMAVTGTNLSPLGASASMMELRRKKKREKHTHGPILGRSVLTATPKLLGFIRGLRCVCVARVVVWRRCLALREVFSHRQCADVCVRVTPAVWKWLRPKPRRYGLLFHRYRHTGRRLCICFEV